MPKASGRYDVRVFFESDEVKLYDSGAVSVQFFQVDFESRWPAILERFSQRFKIDEVLDLGKLEDLTYSLLEQEREGLSEFVDMLETVDQALASEKTEEIPRLPSAAQLPPLKVLFACWEVPCSRHGGGVCMKNLLEYLGRRHDITLVHGYGPEEEGWVEEVQQHVSRIVSVPRRYQLANFRSDTQLPRELINNYTPELRSALEAELFPGRYDIVNYEYSKLFAHMPKVDIPQVLIVRENQFTAKLRWFAENPVSGSANSDRLRDLLKEFYFLTSALPRACRDIIALTEEDGEILSRFQDLARIFVNKIGVETDSSDPDAASPGLSPANGGRPTPTCGMRRPSSLRSSPGRGCGSRSWRRWRPACRSSALGSACMGSGPSTARASWPRRAQRTSSRLRPGASRGWRWRARWAARAAS